ncbi:hypothetical protein DDF67_10175 [Caulobacter endophyticus]|uniref:Uncharacterized protein n=1 Tax=Caulobacter endophyticus TaxID=2172652 RepID=A0A2T9K492_9CAUL|nr:hypothetical protein DDF67_10175 [Caulobacter endophyticus]
MEHLHRPPDQGDLLAGVQARLRRLVLHLGQQFLGGAVIGLHDQVADLVQQRVVLFAFLGHDRSIRRQRARLIQPHEKVASD